MLISAFRLCGKCSTEKPCVDFYRDRGRAGGYQATCKTCQLVYLKSPLGRANMRRYRLKSVYGITEAEFEQMWSKQHGLCAACSEVLTRGRRDTHVDHCHASGRVRGLLCRYCNNALGFAKESVSRLEGLVSYLRSDSAGKIEV